MNNIEKFLRKLSKKEQEVFMLVFLQLKKDYSKVPHVKPLQGMKGWFRVRVGRYRIIFSVTAGQVGIQRIRKRDEQTYRNL